MGLSWEWEWGVGISPPVSALNCLLAVPKMGLLSEGHKTHPLPYASLELRLAHFSAE